MNREITLTLTKQETEYLGGLLANQLKNGKENIAFDDRTCIYLDRAVIILKKLRSGVNTYDKERANNE